MAAVQAPVIRRAVEQRALHLIANANLSEETASTDWDGWPTHQLPGEGHGCYVAAATVGALLELGYVDVETYDVRWDAIEITYEGLTRLEELLTEETP